MNNPTSRYEKVVKVLHSLENGILVGILLTMILMAVAQILLRNLFDSSIVWGDALLRVLVLWVGLLGAMAASRTGNHIRIDLLTRLLSSRTTRWMRVVVDLFTAVICSVMVYYSFELVYSDYASQTRAFAKVPTWLCMAIIPFAFAIIALRFFILSILHVTRKEEGPR